MMCLTFSRIAEKSFGRFTALDFRKLAIPLSANFAATVMPSERVRRVLRGLDKAKTRETTIAKKRREKSKKKAHIHHNFGFQNLDETNNSSYIYLYT